MSTEPTKWDTRFRRLRLKLGYWILPGTNEYNASVARRLGMHELSHQYEEADSNGIKRHCLEAYRTLKSRIPVRDELDEAYAIEDLDPYFKGN